MLRQVSPQARTLVREATGNVNAGGVALTSVATVSDGCGKPDGFAIVAVTSGAVRPECAGTVRRALWFGSADDP